MNKMSSIIFNANYTNKRITRIFLKNIRVIRPFATFALNKFSTARKNHE